MFLRKGVFKFLSNEKHFLYSSLNHLNYKYKSLNCLLRKFSFVTFKAITFDSMNYSVSKKEIRTNHSETLYLKKKLRNLFVKNRKSYK